jgi:hypothetical protein
MLKEKTNTAVSKDIVSKNSSSKYQNFNPVEDNDSDNNFNSKVNSLKSKN